MANQLNPEEGIWDYTDEFKLLIQVAKIVCDGQEILAPELKRLFYAYYQG